MASHQIIRECRKGSSLPSGSSGNVLMSSLTPVRIRSSTCRNCWYVLASARVEVEVEVEAAAVAVAS